MIDLILALMYLGTCIVVFIIIPSVLIGTIIFRVTNAYLDKILDDRSRYNHV